MDVHVKSHFRSLWLVMLTVLLTGFFGGMTPMVARAEDNSSTVPGNPTYTEDAFYYSDQYMWKVSLFVAKSDTVNKDSSNMNEFYRIGNQAVYLTPVSNWNGWAAGSRPSNISGLFFSKENKVDTLMELQSKSGDVNALNPVQLASGSGIYLLKPPVQPPYVPQLSDGDIYDNGVIYGDSVGSITKVASYFNSLDTINTVLNFYAGKQGVSKEDLVKNLEFTIDGETRTGWNPKGILPDAISDNPTNQVEWLIVYEPVSIVYVKDTAHPGSYYGYALSATDFAVSQIKHQMDWRYDETRWTAWAGQQPDAWKPNANRQHVSRLAFLLMGNSVITNSTWYGLVAGSGVDQNAAIPFNRWFSDQQVKYGGWGMARALKPAEYNKPRDNDYRPNTDVILSTPVYSNINAIPGSELTVTYKINGEVIGTDSLVAPMKTESYSYLKWRTPDVSTVTSYDLEMSISPYPEGTINCGGNEYTHRTLTIRPLEESTPPDPKVGDTMPTDLPANLVPPTSVPGEDTADETVAPVIKSVKAVTEAPYYKNETVKIEVVTNRATKNLTFTNTDSGVGKQFGSDSLGDGMLISRSVNELSNEIVWTIEFVPANLGVNRYAFKSLNAAAGESEAYAFDVEVLVDPDLPVIYDVVINPVRALYTLYEEVVKTPLTYEVYFKTNGGNEMGAQSAEYNTLLTEPGQPTREGYTFKGWYKDPSFVYPWNFESDRIMGVTTVYAKWEINTYFVHFDPQGGSDTFSPITAEYGANIEEPAPIPTRSNYVFLGWFKEIGCHTPWNFTEDTIAGDTTLYGKWDATALTVTFDSQGGSVVGSISADYNMMITSPSDPFKPGFTFKGWYQDAACNTVWTFASDRVQADLTLFAKWDVNLYTVSFDSLGGSVVPAQTAQNESVTAKPVDPIRSGYSFGGWFKEDACINAWDFGVDKVTQDTTLYALWTADEAAIEFVANNGTDVPKMVGATDREILDTSMPITVRDGYTFNGWFASADFSGDVITALPDKYPMGTTIYYAKWTAEPAFIDFVTNGGSDVATMTGVTDQAIAPTTMPATSRAGYTFSGWFAEADFSGTEITALPGQYPIGTTTYYAKWTANPSVISFEENGGSSVDDLVGVTDLAITDTALPVSTKEHYTLEGWYETADFSSTKLSALPDKFPVDGVTYYAKWTPVKYTVSFDAQGGSAVLAQQIDYDTYATTPETPSREGFVFKGWFKESQCTNAWYFGTDKITSDVTIFAKWEEGIPGPEVPLNDWSWEQINQIAELGLGESYFDVGEEKNITLSTGEVLTLQIYGFNHDQLADGTSNKTNITFGLKNLMAEMRVMNPTATNVGGWEGSSMRSWVKNTLTTELPNDLQGTLKSVIKPTSYGNASMVINNSISDKLFLFSQKEIGGDNVFNSAQEGYQYECFSLGKSSYSKVIPNVGQKSWWLRSPNRGVTTAFHYIEVSGQYNNVMGAHASLLMGVNFGFAIGNAPTNTYPITYNSNGGSAVSNGTGTLNQLITAPTAPRKTNMTFGGWFKDAGLTQPWDFATDKISGATTLYAKWGAQITFDSQGGSAVTSIVTDTYKTFSAPPSPSRDGWVFKGWYKEAGCLSAWNFAVDQPTENRTLYAKWEAGLPGPEVPLEYWSWDQINRVAELGLAESYFDVGESKNIMVNGETLTLQIYGFDHDILADGTGNKTNITFGLKNLMATKQKMNASYTNIGGWNSSELRMWMNGTLFSQLPSDIQNIVKTINKRASSGNYSTSILTSQDKLFIPSVSEIINTGDTVLKNEGTLYQVFTNTVNLNKTFKNGDTPIWWLRSPVYGNSSEYHFALYQGVGMNASANSYGVCFAFAIGNSPTNTYTVNFDSQGGSAVVSTTATLNTTITAPTAPTKANAIFDGWYKDAGFASKWDFESDKITGTTTLYAKWSSLPAVGTPLADCSWDQIAAVANAGLGDVYWDVGAEKDMILSTGEVLTMQIYDFDHDNRTDGVGKANITFGTKNLLTDTHQITTSSYNIGGWGASTMRTWINDSLYSQLDTVIKNNLVLVKKETSNGWSQQTLTISDDKLFLFSEKEVSGLNTASLNGEGYLYPIFKNNTSRIKSLSNGTGVAKEWWLRSPQYSSSNANVLITQSGEYGWSSPSFGSRGVAFGFSMGKMIDLPPVGTPLKDCSWQQVANVANAGLGDDYWNIGDTKDMTLSTGEIVTMQVYDFNHDDKSDGSGKTNITFGTKNLMAETKQMNYYNDIVHASWSSSIPRSWLNSTIYDTLPNGLKSSIKTVKKQTIYETTSIQYTEDNLFLFSEMEITGTNAYTTLRDGVRYPIFSDQNSLIKKTANGTGASTIYWTRTPSGSSQYMYIDASGYPNSGYYGPAYGLGIAFGFCLGNAPQYTVTFDTQGGTAVTSKTAEINTTISAPATPTKSGMTFAGWFKDAAGSAEWNFTTDKITGPTTLYGKWITLPAIGTSLEACSWDQIAYISKAGLADTYFDVGNEKNVVIEGQTYAFLIYGFNHDDKADGSGKAGITFGMKGVMSTQHYMNPTNLNYFGWDGSDMRAYLNGVTTVNQNQSYASSSVYSQLPSDLKTAMKTANKNTSGGYNDQTLKTSNDKLFLFSEAEVISPTSYTLGGEGTKYSIFTDNNSRRKFRPNSSEAWWYLRSPNNGQSNNFMYVNTGMLYGVNASMNNDVCFGFCV